jgi:ElaA protein
MNDLTWKLLKFEELSVFQLYELLKLRTAIFVVEQNCPYQELDGKDPFSFHLLGYDKEELVTYARILPVGLSYPSVASIGRVVVKQTRRKEQFGKQLMHESIKHTKELFGNVSIKIGAQLYLKNFYENLGFEQTSDVYLDENMPHIEMLLKDCE